jgi:hypothetical protein
MFISMQRRIVGCIVILFLAATTLFAEHPLLVGVRLAETDFKDWRYGYRAHRKQLNCVQFIVAVVEQLLRRELTTDERNAILINNIGRRKNLSKLILEDDKRIRGIQTALVEMSKGQVVDLSEARPGDFVQYWLQKNGKWIGHAAIIQEVRDENGMRCAIVFGSHQSLGGVGIGEFEIGLNEPGVKVYLVRFKS